MLDLVFTPATVKGPGGRLAYHGLVLCKILFRQRLNQLSDEAAQFYILDYSCLQRFLGQILADPVADQNTIREFREALQRATTFPSPF